MTLRIFSFLQIDICYFSSTRFISSAIDNGSLGETNNNKVIIVGKSNRKQE